MEIQGHMRRAIELAGRGWGRVSPNPLVGAVVVRGDEVVGEGWHEGPGLPHAEAMALGEAGELARGATAFTTLEPCNHFGRTPPCTRALVDAGVSRVVVAALDPNLGDGSPGVADLRSAGLEVVTGVLAIDAEQQNEAFLTHVRTGRPFVVLKMAGTLDGKAAARDGSSKWITGEAARADVQLLRAWSDAVAIGSGTAVADDPSLTVRNPALAGTRPPLRVLIDTSGRVAPTGKLFDRSVPTLVATTDLTTHARIDEWRASGADVTVLDRDEAGGVSLPALVEHLGKRDVQGLLIEGGPSLAWSAIRDGVVDKVVFYFAPLLAGGSGARSVIAGSGFAPIGESVRVEIKSVERVDEDLRVEAYVHRDR
ncbi:MAG TPA: bifunctional diaminohydroxyphosphoribosylaminopyrimidine deaminase/5-amino-6-(5-phosphoribosylamino)uracil reductase RibD [Actinomycetota bacterium]|nr:bifunctional diaminohydroxyphosphoribosylaminopyrimidine deaminase/5-amino-6-(5-phosphoribosylamino)uracil reductase RibD [Actinomycetota bacterium]